MNRTCSLLLAACLLSMNMYAAVTEQKFIVHFATDKFELDVQARKVLDSILAFAKNATYYEAFLEAHTDNSGSNEHNMELSMMRAENVRDYLMNKGFAARQLIVEWFGAAKPVKSNATPEGQSDNRRAVITVKKYFWNSAAEILARRAWVLGRDCARAGNIIAARQHFEFSVSLNGRRAIEGRWPYRMLTRCIGPMATEHALSMAKRVRV